MPCRFVFPLYHFLIANSQDGTGVLRPVRLSLSSNNAASSIPLTSASFARETFTLNMALASSREHWKQYITSSTSASVCSRSGSSHMRESRLVSFMLYISYYIEKAKSYAAQWRFFISSQNNLRLLPAHPRPRVLRRSRVRLGAPPHRRSWRMMTGAGCCPRSEGQRRSSCAGASRHRRS